MLFLKLEVTMYQENFIRNLLETRDDAIERAMVALFRRQTEDEKSSEKAKHNNCRGFSAAHAKKGTYYAKWVLSGRKLSGWHLKRAREIALNYTKQLTLISNAGR
jgi:hypothetical protein